LRTKGGKEKEFPVHHLLEEILDSYLDVSGLRANPTGPLFPTTLGKTRKLGARPMTRIDAARMLKRLLAKAGISVGYSPHSFRATGLTRFLEEGGTLEGAQNIADHADSRTTKLYDRRQQMCSAKTWSGFGTEISAKITSNFYVYFALSTRTFLSPAAT
jgi:integrase/recombinase XerD